jgi:methylmalonyl-CoA mutase cobalamin-binding subunit
LGQIKKALVKGTAVELQANLPRMEEMLIAGCFNPGVNISRILDLLAKCFKQDIKDTHNLS